MARRYIRDKLGRFAAKGGKRLGKKASYGLEPDSPKAHYGMAARRRKRGKVATRKFLKRSGSPRPRTTRFKAKKRILPATISAGKVARRKKDIQLGSPLRGFKAKPARRQPWDKPKDTLRKVRGKRWATAYEALK